MKSIFKWLLLLILFIGGSYGAYFFIFNQGIQKGLLIAFGGILVCVLLFSVSLYGLAAGEIRAIRFRTRMEIAGLTVFSILLGLTIGIMALANTFVVISSGNSDLNSDEKARSFASTFFQLPTQKELLKTERNGVTYFYAPEFEKEIDKFDGLIQQKQDFYHAFFGTEKQSNLAVEFHSSYDTLVESTGVADTAGYYSSGNHTIHVVPTDSVWEMIFLHEYTHYQSDLFTEKHALPALRIPHWFEEGIADYLAEADNSYWHDLASLEMKDFHSLDSIIAFQAAGTDTYDPYIQSYLAVESLAAEHGEDIITDLLMSRSHTEFYSNLEELIQQDFDTFQESFIEEMIKESAVVDEWFNEAYEAKERKQYWEVEKIIKKMESSGMAYEKFAAFWLLNDVKLEQGLYEEALVHLEKAIAESDQWEQTDILLAMAEVYLVIDTGKALEHFDLAEAAMPEDHYRSYELELLAEAYEKAASKQPDEGFKMLVEEDLIMDWNIREKVKDMEQSKQQRKKDE